MDQTRILTFDEFVSQQSAEQVPHTPEMPMDGGMEMPPMGHAPEMPAGSMGTAGEELPMDPNAEPVVPEIPHHEGEPAAHNVEEPNMPTQNITETFKKYGNKRAMKCRTCNNVVDSSEMPKPGMCEDCYNRGGDDE